MKKSIISMFILFSFSYGNSIKAAIPSYVQFIGDKIKIEREDYIIQCDLNLEQCEEYNFIDGIWNIKNFNDFDPILQNIFKDSVEYIKD